MKFTNLTTVYEDHSYINISEEKLKLSAKLKVRLHLKFGGIKEFTIKDMMTRCNLKYDSCNDAVNQSIRDGLVKRKKSYKYKLIVKPSKITIFPHLSIDDEERMIYNQLIKPNPSLFNYTNVIIRPDCLQLLKYLRYNYKNKEINKKEILKKFNTKSFKFLIDNDIVRRVKASHYILSEYYDEHKDRKQVRKINPEMLKEAKLEKCLNTHNLNIEVSTLTGCYKKLINLGYEPEPTNNNLILLKLPKDNPYIDVAASIVIYDSDYIMISPSLSRNPIYQDNTNRIHTILRGIIKFINKESNSDYKYNWGDNYLVTRYDLAQDFTIPHRLETGRNGELKHSELKHIIPNLPDKMLCYVKQSYHKSNTSWVRLEYRNVTGNENIQTLQEFINDFKLKKFDFLDNIYQQQQLIGIRSLYKVPHCKR